MSNERKNNHFVPDHRAPEMRAMEDITPQKKPVESWGAYYKDYFLKRPMLILIAIGLALEIQPYEPIQPSYFIASRKVNLDEIVLEGTEDEEAHREAVKSEVLAQIEYSKQCQAQRDIEANTARNQCIQAGKSTGYCRHVYESAKELDCPPMPEL